MLHGAAARCRPEYAGRPPAVDRDVPGAMTTPFVAGCAVRRIVAAAVERWTVLRGVVLGFRGLHRLPQRSEVS